MAESEGLLIGRYLRFKGGRVWHRIRDVVELGQSYSLPTMCRASGDAIADVTLGDVRNPCKACERLWDTRCIARTAEDG